MTNYVTVARVGDVARGDTKGIALGGKRMLLCNVEGSYFAVDDVCTHDGGPLGQGRLFGHAIECPRHGARFDVRTGRVLALPAVVPIKSYSVRIEGTDIQVSVGT
ncbi:MAG: non-heme iron oxygenase ferredoxin subunit [Chloroflexi bacterium]|nr:non-heme iron oxygenase ferredoxin subunit [Chloroflexota bacterium]